MYDQNFIFRYKSFVYNFNKTIARLNFNCVDPDLGIRFIINSREIIYDNLFSVCRNIEEISVDEKAESALKFYPFKKIDSIDKSQI